MALSGASIVAVMIATLLAAVPARAAADRNVTLDYVVYVGGFETIKFSLKTALGASDYKIKMALNGQGVLDWWFSWSVNAFSEGRLADGAVVPVRSGADSAWNGKQRQTRLRFAGGGAPSVTMKPPADDDDDRDVVPPALRTGTRDPVSAIFAGLSRLGKGGDCIVREAVFDGRRRYDLVLDHRGEEVIPRNDYSPYAGSALRCAIKIERIAGFRRNPPSSTRWRSTGEITVWIGRAFASFPPVPVRMALDTAFGGLRAHLVRATLTEGGRTHDLAMAR